VGSGLPLFVMVVRLTGSVRPSANTLRPQRNPLHLGRPKP
jgi:hypothetical protein